MADRVSIRESTIVIVSQIRLLNGHYAPIVSNYTYSFILCTYAKGVRKVARLKSAWLIGLNLKYG